MKTKSFLPKQSFPHFIDLLRNNRKLNSRFVLIILSLLILLNIAWNSINYVSHLRPDVDSGVYASVATHLLQEKILYRDIFDHKPPMIHLLDALALNIGDGTINAIRYMERVFSCIGSILVFFIILYVFKSVLLSLGSSFLFLIFLYNPSIFDGGNLTEEYGIVFVLGGILSAIFAKDLKHRWIPVDLSLISGFCFSLATFTKEPFLLSSIPWFFYLIIKKQRKNVCVSFKRGIAFIIGALLPFILLIIYLIINRALLHWVDVISYSLTYSKNFSGHIALMTKFYNNIQPAYDRLLGLSNVMKIALCIGGLSAFCPTFLKRYKYIPAVFFVQFLMDYWGTLISSAQFGHYYMQLCGAFIFISASSFMYLSETLKIPNVQLFIIFLLSFFVWDFPFFKHVSVRLKVPFKKSSISNIAKYVIYHKKPEDLIWGPEMTTTSIYLETGLLSPTKYIYAFPHLFLDTMQSTREEKIHLIKTNLRNNPPQYILLSKQLDFWKKEGFTSWISENYVEKISDGSIVLYVKNDHTEQAQNTATGSSPINLNKGLIAYYPFNGTAKDESKQDGLHGTIHGATLTLDRFGNLNSAYSFNGKDNYIQLPTGFSNFLNGITISLWACPLSPQGEWTRFIDFGNGAASNNIIFSKNAQTDMLTFMIYPANALHGKSVNASQAIEIGRWQHFTVVQQTSGYTVFYKDGRQIVTGITAVPANVIRKNNFIAKSNWSHDDYYHGYMDEIRIYNRALSPHEVRRLFTGTNDEQKLP